MSYCSMVLQDRTWPWTEKLDALTHLEADDLVNFVPMLLSRTFVECYISGTNLNLLYDSLVSSPFVFTFLYTLWCQLYIYNYFSGNVEKNEAESMVKHIEDVLFNDPRPISRPIFPSQSMTNRVVELGKRIKCFYHQEGSNPSDENSALVHYIQV